MLHLSVHRKGCWKLRRIATCCVLNQGREGAAIQRSRTVAVRVNFLWTKVGRSSQHKCEWLILLVTRGGTREQCMLLGIHHQPVVAIKQPVGVVPHSHLPRKRMHSACCLHLMPTKLHQETALDQQSLTPPASFCKATAKLLHSARH
jgi:hypothetical protein